MRALCSQNIPFIAEQLVRIDPWLTLNYQEKTLINYFNQNQTSTFEIIFDKEISGVISFRSPWLRGYLLELLGIFPHAQQQGIGKELINWLENLASENELNNLWTLVSSFNEKGQTFYHKMGFTKVGTISQFISDEYDEILLRKSLFSYDYSP